MDTLLVILCVPILLYCGLMLYLSSRPFLKPAALVWDDLPQVSILVPFRNEQNHIRICAEAILSNNYPAGRFELILVDDHSEDGSLKSLEDLLANPLFRVIHSEGEGKKMALMSGIKAAKYPLILCTDADCRPDTEWIKTMAGCFSGMQLNMLCGPVSLRHENSLLKALQATESVALVGISAAMLNAGFPSTCNGANLMFRKDLFYSIGGYGDSAGMPASGDDDLLMQTFFRHKPDGVRYLLHPDAMVFAEACNTFNGFIQQRLRWISKRRHYSYAYNGILQTLVFLQLLASVFLSFLLVFYGNWFAALILLPKFASEWIFGRKLKRIFSFKLSLLPLLPIYQMYILLLPLMGIVMKTQWKGRPIS